jgi:hypothetical protein
MATCDKLNYRNSWLQTKRLLPDVFACNLCLLDFGDEEVGRGFSDSARLALDCLLIIGRQAVQSLRYLAWHLALAGLGATSGECGRLQYPLSREKKVRLFY